MLPESCLFVYAEYFLSPLLRKKVHGTWGPVGNPLSHSWRTLAVKAA